MLTSKELYTLRRSTPGNRTGAARTVAARKALLHRRGFVRGRAHEVAQPSITPDLTWPRMTGDPPIGDLPLLNRARFEQDRPGERLDNKRAGLPLLPLSEQWKLLWRRTHRANGGSGAHSIVDLQ